MTPGLIGKKIGMTRVFTDEGKSRPVTVIEAGPNRITQVKTAETDGYNALQVTTGERRASRVSKPMQGHFAKARVEPGRGVWEFRLEQPFQPAEVIESAEPDEPVDSEAEAETEAEAEAEAGTETETEAETETNDAKAETDATTSSELTVAMFSQGQKVDVTGRTIGKGFAGVIKRHGFRGGRASHGNSKAHRVAGATGNAQDPGRIFKGKKMAGRMGGARRVQQGLEVVRVDAERNLLLISGSIPGSKGADVIIRPSIKVRNSKGA